MLKRYRVWLTAAVIFQLLAGFTHVITLFVSPPPSNEAERQMTEMMQKLEELTLYVIQLDKENTALKAQVTRLEAAQK